MRHLQRVRLDMKFNEFLEQKKQDRNLTDDDIEYLEIVLTVLKEVEYQSKHQYDYGLYSIEQKIKEIM